MKESNKIILNTHITCWKENPEHWQRMKDVAQAMLRHEIGTGSGLRLSTTNMMTQGMFYAKCMVGMVFTILAISDSGLATTNQDLLEIASYNGEGLALLFTQVVLDMQADVKKEMGEKNDKKKV